MEGGTEPKYVAPLNPQLVKFFEHYMVCLVRRLDSIKRLKTKEEEAKAPLPPNPVTFGVTELRDYQRESYQFRIKLGRLRQLRAEGGGAITQQNYHQAGLMNMGQGRLTLGMGADELLKKEEDKANEQLNETALAKEATAAKLKAK